MATYWVRSSGGNDVNDGLSYAQAFATIAEGFDNVGQGDTLRLVNDGVHTAPAFSDALTVQGTFNGTNYTSDPGLIIEGVDSAGDPALATVTAVDATNTYFLYNASSAANYIWVRGVKFDWSFYGVTAGTLRHILTAPSSMPREMKWTSCYFYFGDRGVTLTQDLQWSPFVGITASNNQAVSPGPGTMEVSHCFFENAILFAPSVGGITSDFHHNVIHISAVNYASAAFPAYGGSFYKDTREHKFYNNTVVREYQGTNVAGTLYTNANSDVSQMSYYNNVLFLNAGDTASGTLAGVMRQAPTTSDKEAAAQMDYEVFAFGTNVNSPLEHSSGGVGSYAFDEAWRAGGSAVVTLTVPTNSVELNNITFTELFNTTAVWTWDGTGGYELSIPWDFRLVQQRTAGLAGAVPGAVDAVVNNPPVAGVVTYAVTAGNVLATTATDGVLSNITDPDDDTLTAAVVTDVTHGVLVFNTTTGGFTYTPNATFAGTDLFTFKANDGSIDSNVSTATINVDAFVVAPPGPGRDPIDALIDSAPFFRPILELDARIKYSAKRNRKLKTDLRRYDENIAFEETTQRYFNLATNVTQQITLGGVASAQYLSIETDQDISVSVNSDTNFVPVTDVLAIMNTAVTSLYLKNASTTNTARVVILAVD